MIWKILQEKVFHLRTNVFLDIMNAYLFAKENVCPFLASPRKGPKEGALGGHSEKACPPKYPLRRFADRCPKMSRFLNTYRSKARKLSHGRRPKIGTFSGVGWRCGGGFLRGRLFEAPLKPTSLVTFLFGNKKVTLPHHRQVQKISFLIIRHIIGDLHMIH